MKLRNKKTGEYGKFIMCHDDDRYPFYIETAGVIRIYYSNFEEMLEAGWEAYVVPKEPLIKDEKIRKAVRAWAEVCGIDGVVIVSKYQLVSLDKPCSIEFYGAIYPEYVHNEEHTIAELCGEEEG